MPGYLAIGAITELTGAAKRAGKTTLLGFFGSCVVDGGKGLGGATLQSPLVFLTEQTHSTFREVLRRANLLNHDDISILSYWDVKGLSWPAIAQMAHREADRIGARVVFVDTLAQFAGITLTLRVGFKAVFVGILCAPSTAGNGAAVRDCFSALECVVATPRSTSALVPFTRVSQRAAFSKVSKVSPG